MVLSLVTVSVLRAANMLDQDIPIILLLMVGRFVP